MASSPSFLSPTQLHLPPHASRTTKLPRGLPLRTPAAAARGGALAGDERSAPPRPLSVSPYVESLQNGTFPDPFTFPPLLKSLADSKSLLEGEMIHAHVVKMGFEGDLFVRNNLIRLYAVCGDMVSAHNLFDRFPQRDVVSWTTLISGYSKMGLLEEAIGVFLDMVDEGLEADAVAVVAVLAACAKLGDLGLGKKVHRYVHISSVKLDVFAWNALISMYAKCGEIDSAYKCFKKMPERNVVSWNAMISGFVHAGEFKRALLLFERMQSKGIEPDDATLIGVLNSCANLGALEMGRWVHVYMFRIGLKAEGVLGNALVDMYAKCGMIDHAVQVFDDMRKRDVYAYTSMIVGLAMHGQGKKALNLFDEMLRAGMNPNGVTFVGVLSACAHVGLVELGLRHFEDMSSVHSITPQVEHYGCVVDMLGRAGHLDRALDFIREMPVKPDTFIWGSLLGACKIHGEVAIGESVMKHLLSAENREDGNYVLLSNIYASNDRRHDSIRVRKAMRRKKVKKAPGCSVIEIDGVVHEFRVKKSLEE